MLNVITKGPRAGRAARAGSILPVSTPDRAPIPEVIAARACGANPVHRPRSVLTSTPDNPPPLQLVPAGSNRPRLSSSANAPTSP